MSGPVSAINFVSTAGMGVCVCLFIKHEQEVQTNLLLGTNMFLLCSKWKCLSLSGLILTAMMQ